MSFRWLVETHTAVYDIDMRAGLLTRHRTEAPRSGFPQARLRRDEQPIELLSVDVCQVGQPMSLYLQIRDDGVMTWRETTPVVSITEVE